MGKTKYYITTMHNGKNCVLQHSGLMYKYERELQKWVISDYWFDALFMGDFTDFKEITEERAQEIIKNGGIFKII